MADGRKILSHIYVAKIKAAILICLLLSCVERKPQNKDAPVNRAGLDAKKALQRTVSGLKKTGCYRSSSGLVKVTYREIEIGGRKMALTPDGAIALEQMKSCEAGLQLAASPNPNTMWPSCTIPYSYDPNLTDEDVQKLGGFMDTITSCSPSDNWTSLADLKRDTEKAMRMWEKSPEGHSTGFRFVPAKGVEFDHLVITIDPEFSGSWANLGRTGGTQFLAYGGFYQFCWGIPQHELGHTIGFLHQHNHPDRDKHLNIHWENITTDMKDQFIKSLSQSAKLGPYDPSSIMHYSSLVGSVSLEAGDIAGLFAPSLTLKDGSRLDSSTTLSVGDIKAARELCNRTNKVFVDPKTFAVPAIEVKQKSPSLGVEVPLDTKATWLRYSVYRTKDRVLCWQEDHILPGFYQLPYIPCFGSYLPTDFSLEVAACRYDQLTSSMRQRTPELLIYGHQASDPISCGKPAVLAFKQPSLGEAKRREIDQQRARGELDSLVRSHLRMGVVDLSASMTSCRSVQESDTSSLISTLDAIIKEVFAGSTLEFSDRELADSVLLGASKFGNQDSAFIDQIAQSAPQRFVRSDNGKDWMQNVSAIAHSCQSAGGHWSDIDNLCLLDQESCSGLGGQWDGDSDNCLMDTLARGKYRAIYHGWISYEYFDEDYRTFAFKDILYFLLETYHESSSSDDALGLWKIPAAAAPSARRVGDPAASSPPSALGGAKNTKPTDSHPSGKTEKKKGKWKKRLAWTVGALGVATGATMLGMYIATEVMKTDPTTLKAASCESKKALLRLFRYNTCREKVFYDRMVELLSPGGKTLNEAFWEVRDSGIDYRVCDVM